MSLRAGNSGASAHFFLRLKHILKAVLIGVVASVDSNIAIV
jgi:hypothetical protein